MAYPEIVNNQKKQSLGEFPSINRENPNAITKHF